MGTTTDLNILRDHPEQFTWGRIIKIMEIGDYTIAEFHHRHHESMVEYHLWINGKDTRTSYDSLDSALAGAIARKYEGCNTQAGYYFMKMIGATK